MSFPDHAPIYQTDQSIRQYGTVIKQHIALLDLDEVDRALFTKAEHATHVLSTKQTIFHPQGGGQPSDEGSMCTEDGAHIFHVSLARQSLSFPGTIFHAGDFGSDSLAVNHFQPGNHVRQDIDSAARDLNSRAHTAGHLIGFAVHALREQIGLVGEGKASHYPDAAYVEFIGLIAGEHKPAIQAKVDEYVRGNFDVGIKFLGEEDARMQSTAVPDVIKSDSEGWVRLMVVEGLGAYPCGGTHLPTTKDVGKVEVRNIRRKNNITKITYRVA